MRRAHTHGRPLTFNPAAYPNASVVSSVGQENHHPSSNAVILDIPDKALKIGTMTQVPQRRRFNMNRHEVRLLSISRYE
jgi:hypothetical protein